MTSILETALGSAEPEEALRDIYNGLFVFDRPKVSKLDRAKANLGIDLRKNERFTRHFAEELENA